MTEPPGRESRTHIHFPQEHLGANSGGLSAVSGAAHTMLAILLVRQAVLCLLSDMQGLKSAHDDATSAFDLEQVRIVYCSTVV